MIIEDWGLISYADAWKKQKDLVEEVKNGRESTFVLCEHPHVYTFGKSANHANLLVSDELLKSLRAERFDIERGGDITYHGPGQLVGYPIFDLPTLGIGARKYVDLMEESLILTLKDFKLQTKRIDSLTGIWFEEHPIRKIAAIGIKISRGVTMHGFALNVNTDMDYFKHMIPCGITDKSVTSMEIELGEAQDMQEVKRVVSGKFQTLFKR
jgi:lipoyl(octanoyl) transferase